VNNQFNGRPDAALLRERAKRVRGRALLVLFLNETGFDIFYL